MLSLLLLLANLSPHSPPRPCSSSFSHGKMNYLKGEHVLFANILTNTLHCIIHTSMAIVA